MKKNEETRREKMTDNQRVMALAKIIRSYAPTKKDDRILMEGIERQKDLTDAEILKDLSCTLQDGLYYGNWPWNRAAIGSVDIDRRRETDKEEGEIVLGLGDLSKIEVEEGK